MKNMTESIIKKKSDGIELVVSELLDETASKIDFTQNEIKICSKDISING